MELKTCTKCLKEKELGEFYKQKKKRANGEEFYYILPQCKECTKERSAKWQQSIDPERRRAYFKKCDSSDRRKKIKREFSKQQKENGYYKNYQQENKEKFNQYQKLRKANKTHDITEQEWLECLEFFNDSCAYCGLSEVMAIKEFGQQLHKEHVEHTGANDITNCVPACKGCNSQKWEYELNDWYNENNPIYSKRRYNKLVKWLISFC